MSLGVIFMNTPLAIKMAPKSLKDVIGQKHLVGKDKILTNLAKSKNLFSMILYGPPGVGKTSIANAIVNDLDLHYRFLNATINNKKDFDAVVEESKMLGGIILIMDEIHRLNKDKQDLLLPCIESGLITLIGLTTSNPYYIINPAIRSRCHIFELKPLTEEDIILGLKKAVRCQELMDIKISNDTIKYIAKISGNDLRYAYNLLEISYYYKTDHNVNIEVIKSINNKPVFDSDKDGDNHYNIISALQKSIRGSDVDASLHYLGRLILSGDFDIIYRRLLVIAYEDIGLANPSIGPKVVSAITACERIGMPEARIVLANVVIDMALSPKSNTAIMALDIAMKDIEKGNCGDIPKYLKDAAIGYKYPHDYPNTMVYQEYLPSNLLNKKYYIPKDESKYEQSLKITKDKIDKIKMSLK